MLTACSRAEKLLGSAGGAGWGRRKQTRAQTSHGWEGGAQRDSALCRRESTESHLWSVDNTRNEAATTLGVGGKLAKGPCALGTQPGRAPLDGSPAHLMLLEQEKSKLRSRPGRGPVPSVSLQCPLLARLNMVHRSSPSSRTSDSRWSVGLRGKNKPGQQPPAHGPHLTSHLFSYGP